MSVPAGQRVVLVTGGSSGIGATARALHARGDELALLAQSGVGLQRVAAELPGCWCCRAT